MSFQLAEQLQQKVVPVNQLCRLLDISRSGYDTAHERVQAQQTVCDASVHLKAAFVAIGGAYGSRRLRTAVAARGYEIALYRLSRLIRKTVLNLQFNPTAPHQAWVPNITYIRTRSGCLYLAVVLDLFAHKDAGWAMAPSKHATLVCRALQRPNVQRQPAAGLIAFGPRQPVRQLCAPKTAEQPWLGRQREPRGQLLGQRGNVTLLPEFEDGARLAKQLR